MYTPSIYITSLFTYILLYYTKLTYYNTYVLCIYFCPTCYHAFHTYFGNILSIYFYATSLNIIKPEQQSYDSTLSTTGVTNL